VVLGYTSLVYETIGTRLSTGIDEFIAVLKPKPGNDQEQDRTRLSAETRRIYPERFSNCKGSVNHSKWS